VTRYLLDTTFIIDHLRADPAAVDRFARLFDDGDEAFVNEVAVCEAWTAARTDDDPQLGALLNAIGFVQPPLEAAARAGRWRDDARRSGQVLSLADALIAAAANALGATVLTRNERDFRLTPVRVETY
jgi:predicted nucleic acid-binding protein